MATTFYFCCVFQSLSLSGCFKNTVFHICKRQGVLVRSFIGLSVSLGKSQNKFLGTKCLSLGLPSSDGLQVFWRFFRFSDCQEVFRPELWYFVAKSLPNISQLHGWSNKRYHKEPCFLHISWTIMATAPLHSIIITLISSQFRQQLLTPKEREDYSIGSKWT